MYLRNRKLDSVLAVAAEYIVSGELPSGGFVKIGFDEVEGKKSYWLFTPEPIDESVEVVKNGRKSKA